MEEHIKQQAYLTMLYKANNDSCTKAALKYFIEGSLQVGTAAGLKNLQKKLSYESLAKINPYITALFIAYDVYTVTKTVNDANFRKDLQRAVDKKTGVAIRYNCVNRSKKVFLWNNSSIYGSYPNAVIPSSDLNGKFRIDNATRKTITYAEVNTHNTQKLATLRKASKTNFIYTRVKSVPKGVKVTKKYSIELVYH